MFLQCQQGMARAITTQENLGIEYDEQTVCDVCQDVSTVYLVVVCGVDIMSPLQHESEESNDMIFCDSCNVCVHQVSLVSHVHVYTLKYFYR